MKTNKYRTTESYSNTQCIVASDIFYKVLNVMTSKKMPKNYTFPQLGYRTNFIKFYSFLQKKNNINRNLRSCSFRIFLSQIIDVYDKSDVAISNHVFNLLLINRLILLQNNTWKKL